MKGYDGGFSHYAVPESLLVFPRLLQLVPLRPAEALRLVLLPLAEALPLVLLALAEALRACSRWKT